jgi:ferredoxin
MSDTHKLTVDDHGTFDVPADKRLVLALEDEAGLDQLHACGGVGKCTTCQVTVVQGKASPMTAQEQETLRTRELDATPGIRLSCQMTMTADLTVKAESLLSTSTRKDVGPRPADSIEPVPTFVNDRATNPDQGAPDERA